MAQHSNVSAWGCNPCPADLSPPHLPHLVHKTRTSSSSRAQPLLHSNSSSYLSRAQLFESSSSWPHSSRVAPWDWGPLQSAWRIVLRYSSCYAYGPLPPESTFCSLVRRGIWPMARRTPLFHVPLRPWDLSSLLPTSSGFGIYLCRPRSNFPPLAAPLGTAAHSRKARLPHHHWGDCKDPTWCPRSQLDLWPQQGLPSWITFSSSPPELSSWFQIISAYRARAHYWEDSGQSCSTKTWHSKVCCWAESSHCYWGAALKTHRQTRSICECLLRGSWTCWTSGPPLLRTLSSSSQSRCSRRCSFQRWIGQLASFHFERDEGVGEQDHFILYLPTALSLTLQVAPLWYRCSRLLPFWPWPPALWRSA